MEIKVPSRVRLFLWKLGNSVLPVRVRLGRYISNMDKNCPFCNGHEETIFHNFWECHVAKSIWIEVQNWWKISLHEVSVNNNFLASLFQGDIQGSMREAWYVTLAVTLWILWKVRNNLIFNIVKPEVKYLFSNIKYEALTACACYNITSLKDSTIWYLDPKTALERFTALKRVNFLRNLLNDFDAIGFSDGAWDTNKGKGGTGGFIYTSNLLLSYVFYGPIIQMF